MISHYQNDRRCPCVECRLDRQETRRFWLTVTPFLLTAVVVVAAILVHLVTTWGSP